MFNPESLTTFQLTVSEVGVNEADLILSPLPTGYGYTVGNILRRILLSSLKGAAITEVRVTDAAHQFTTLPGMKEDIVRLVLNLKKVRFMLHDDKAVVLTLAAKGVRSVTAADFNPNSGVTVANPECPIAELTDAKAKLEFQVLVEPGYGYVARETLEYPKIGVLPVDSVFSPIITVSYDVEETRVGELTNLDKLVLRVKTDGTITPLEALNQAIATLNSVAGRLTAVLSTVGATENAVTLADTSGDVSAKALSKKEGSIALEDLDLPLRTVNSLKKSGVQTLGALVALPREELSNIRGLGDTSIKQIIELIEEEQWK